MVEGRTIASSKQFSHAHRIEQRTARTQRRGLQRQARVVPITLAGTRGDTAVPSGVESEDQTAKPARTERDTPRAQTPPDFQYPEHARTRPGVVEIMVTTSPRSPASPGVLGDSIMERDRLCAQIWKLARVSFPVPFLSRLNGK